MSRSKWYCPLCQAEGATPVEFCQNDGARVRPIEERGADWIGKVLDDKYKILRFIDAGGTAEVYEAERTTTGKRVALKLLHATLAAKPDMMDSFLKEAQLVSLIAHPNIVAIEDFGTLPGALHYMVMELLDGDPLSAAIAKGRLPVMTALRYAMQACEGLAAAHARDVIHCDIKPSNIFLQRVPGQVEPVVKILDLGIGRLFASGPPVDTDAPGIVAGTPEYMSPEQATGKPLGPASDIYSMGVAIYEMFFGDVPFTGDSYLQILQDHLRRPPPWPDDVAEEREVPPGARDVVWRALAKKPEDRQGSMLELQRDLATLGRHEKARASSRDVVSRGPAMPAASARGRSMVPARPSRTGRGPVAVREETFTTEEDGTSGRWRLAPEKGRSSRPLMSGIVPLAGSTGGDGEVVELAPDVYWVGCRRGRVLECNAFLRVWKRDGMQISMLVDPGPPRDLDVITQKVEKVIGSLEQLDYVFLNHHDPDVASNAAPIQQRAPRARVICSEDTFRLAHFYGLDAARYTAAESFVGGRTTLATGHEIVFVPTPFCPFRGATMLYDSLSRVLFTGDLFGGARATDLVASDRSWPGVEMFHQVYMPSRRALALAVAAIRTLEPPPTLLAPQHGALVGGDDVPRMLDRIERLEVGLDLPDAAVSDEPFCAAGNDLVREFTELAGEARAKELLQNFTEDSSFPRLVVVDGGRIARFKVTPKLGLEALASDALAALPADQRGDLQRSIREIWKQHDLI
jgi:serine/threonine protein kinase/glyoxylase-like metal-dependent hydrolase (beta-lactamase superfamily II)